MAGIVPRRAALLLALLPFCRPGRATAEGPAFAGIIIDDFAFSPAVLTVAAGTRVVWTNRDDSPHRVVSDASPPEFRSPALDTGDAFDAVFDRPGRWGYFCSLHPHMQGSVVVQ